jgi:hypothetical protein
MTECIKKIADINSIPDDESDRRLDELFDYLYDNCDVNVVDSIMRDVNIKRLKTDVILGILTVTFAYAQSYKYREKFLEGAAREIRNRGIEEDILKGLKGPYISRFPEYDHLFPHVKGAI